MSCTYVYLFDCVGIGTMMRLFQPDILHTWTRGMQEAVVAYTLQCIEVLSSIDEEYVNAPQLLAETIRNFPAYNSLNPIRHFRFQNIWDMVKSDTGKEKKNLFWTTGILKGQEGYKIPAAHLQLLFSCGEPNLLPDHFNWCKKYSFQEPYFNPQQVILHALNAVMEVHWYVHASSLTERQLVTFEFLVSNAQAHVMSLDMMRKRLVQLYTKKAKESFKDLNVREMKLMNNVKFEILSHLPEAKRQSGCDNNIRNTEWGEGCVKKSKVLFNATQKRYLTVEKQMLQKYMHTEYISLARLGLTGAIKGIENKESTNVSEVLATFGDWTLKSSKHYKQQKIVVRDNRGKKEWVPENAEPWNVHPMLLQVNICVCG